MGGVTGLLPAGLRCAGAWEANGAAVRDSVEGSMPHVVRPRPPSQLRLLPRPPALTRLYGPADARTDKRTCTRGSHVT